MASVEQVEFPPLPPELKITMKLDEIIQYEKVRAGVSHNMQFKKPNKQLKKPFQPRRRNRYRSQNWRLRGNGPNTPRWRYFKQSRAQCGRIKAFLQRKWATTPFHSVFQRLGFNPTQEAARSKIMFARNFVRPSRPFTFKKRFGVTKQDPNRIKKLLASAQVYRRSFNGLNMPMSDVPLFPDKAPQPLNKVNLEVLTQALGGNITNIREEKSETGSVVTITRINSNSFDSGFNGSSMNSGFMNLNRNFSNMMPNEYVPYYNGMMNNYQGMYSQPVFSNRFNSMLGTNFNSAFNPMEQASNLNSMAFENLGKPANMDYTSPLLRNSNSINSQTVNVSIPCDTPPLTNPFRKPDGNGVDGKLAIHATTKSFNGRFGQLNPIKLAQESSEMDC